MALIALAPAGCGDVPIRESQVEGTLAPKTAMIVVGQTDREAMRRLLGEPWLASRYWQFDLFQLSDRSSTLTIIFIPLLYSTEGVRGYVLVRYDEHGVVAAYDHGVAREGSAGTGALPEDVTIRAGDVEFRASADGEASYVAVDPPRADAYLARFPSTDRCRILVGVVNDPCGTRVTFDGGSPVVVPSESTRWRPALLPIDATPGTHEVELEPDVWSCAFEASTRLTCGIAETQYAALELTSVAGTGLRSLKRQFATTVSVGSARPDVLREQGLVVHANGEWRVAQEPGR